MNKTYVLAFFLGFIAESYACHAQFRDTKWGDSIDAVTTAEQLSESGNLVDHGFHFVVGDDVSVGNRDVEPHYFFMEDKLFAAAYVVNNKRSSSSLAEEVELNLSHYKHFFRLLEMKYGIADTENVPNEFEALLNSDLPFTSQKFQDLKILWQQENTVWWLLPWPEYALELKSTWENDGTEIELHFVMVSSEKELTSKDIDHGLLRIGVWIIYKDSPNWEKGIEWRREQWGAAEKRKAEQEKKALLKGL